MTPFRSYVVTLMSALSLTIMSLLKFKGGTITYVVVSHSALVCSYCDSCSLLGLLAAAGALFLFCHAARGEQRSYFVLDATWPDMPMPVFWITSLLQHVHTVNTDRPATTSV